MANVGDVLLPILGGIAGTSPYLGSGIRTALSVDQALGRRKWQDAKKQQDQEDKDAKAEDAKAQVEKERLFTEDLKAQIEDWGKETGDPQTASALILMARNNSGKAADEFFKIRNQKEKEAGWTSERFSNVAGDMREANPDGSFGISGRLEGGGSANMQYPKPSVAEVFEPEVHDFGWKKVNNDTPWIKTGTGEDGKPTVFIDEELKAAMAPYRTPEANETESKIIAAQIKVEKAKDNLKKYYTQEAVRGAERRPGGEGGNAGLLPPEPPGSIFDDPGYKHRLLTVQQAEAELERLLTDAQPAESEDSTGAIYEDYDAEGNPIGGF